MIPSPPTLIAPQRVTERGRSLGPLLAGISRNARQPLIEYHWRGNVRELRNVLERAAILLSKNGGLLQIQFG
jgi:transcriptional regulator with PAS, ATPase and Fis domain